MYPEGAVLSTVKTAVEAEDTFPEESITNNLYSPAVAGEFILVAVPPAVVIVSPLINDVVP